jgi:hypothetical protein
MTTHNNLSARYNFTHQYLSAAKDFAANAETIERRHSVRPPSAKALSKHIAAVTSTVFHAVAAIEAEVWTVTNHGPGHHLGSNGVDQVAVARLKPVIHLLDRESLPEKCNVVLDLLGKAPISKGSAAFQDARLLIRLRNELIHYKSQWDHEVDQRTLVRGLVAKRFSIPPFRRDASPIFPKQILGADCAKWASATAPKFLNIFYDHLGVKSPF